MKNLVILGGGYGGMKIISLLLDKLPKEVMITLIDRMPNHCLKTKFYALAVGTIKPQQIQLPFPEHPQLKFKQGEVSHIDLNKNEVHLENGEVISYHDLVIGLGHEDNFRDVPGAEEYAYSIQTMEKAKKTNEALNRLPAGSKISIVGAGLTGVELASELNEKRPDLRISIYDRNPNILPSFPSRLSTYVENWFDNHGIDININANITRIEKNTIFNHEVPEQTDMIIWTAGIQPSKVVRKLDVEKDRYGRIILTQYHNIPGYEHVYVVGDCASLPHSPSAQLAEGQGEQIAQVILSRWKNELLPEEMPVIKLKGVLGALGRKSGFGLFEGRPVTGRVVRLLKSGILWLYKYH